MFRFLFPLLLLLVLGSVHYYLARRLHQWFSSVFPRLRFLYVLIGLLVPAVLMILGFARSLLPLPAWLEQAAGVVSAYWMGVFVYLFLFVALADVVGLVCRLCKRPFVNARGFRLGLALGAVICTVATAGYGFYHACQIQTVSYEVQLEGKTDIADIRMVLVSDLHLGAVGSESRLEKVVEEINRQKPDVVCIAGDFFDSDFTAIRNPERVAQLWNSVRSTYGVYACLGNHDAGETAPQMVAFLKKCGITELSESYTVIDNRLVLVGRLDASPIGDSNGRERGELADFFTRGDDRMPVVVMDHNPANIDDYTQEVDLILSGHTHQGQLFPANLITDMLYAVDYGYYRKDAASPQVIVTSGAGSWGMPMRVGTDHEVVCIQFTS